jgi:hypothetical protein
MTGGETYPFSLIVLASGIVSWYYNTMHKRHQKTLDDIFHKPDRKDIQWDDFIALLHALGANVTERGGSMIGVRLNNRYAVFHQPHPGNEIYPSDLKRIRRFLAETGALEQKP